MAPKQPPKDEKLLTTLGQNLSKALKKSPYPSVEQFCWDQDLSKSTLSRMLRGQVDVRISKLHKISQTLGVSIDKLLREPTRKLSKKK